MTTPRCGRGIAGFGQWALGIALARYWSSSNTMYSQYSMRRTTIGTVQKKSKTEVAMLLWFAGALELCSNQMPSLCIYHLVCPALLQQGLLKVSKLSI